MVLQPQGSQRPSGDYLSGRVVVVRIAIRKTRPIFPRFIGSKGAQRLHDHPFLPQTHIQLVTALGFHRVENLQPTYATVYTSSLVGS